ncbi:MAG TPA: phosphatase PAP2 family protein [Methylomirabilota bacterium]|nr:phosphatase PAP2 family protein [Methylomirabilota bacterium]
MAAGAIVLYIIRRVVNRTVRVAWLAGAALATGLLASTELGDRVDVGLFRAVNRGRGPGADRFFRGITELGSIWASIGAAGVLAARGRRRAAARGLGAASAAWLAGQGLKRLFDRPRPYVADPDGVRLLAQPPRATSWPSSHPAVLLAFVTVAGRDLELSLVARTALRGLAAAVGISRTYVGVHYPADVVGGLLLGQAVADAMSQDAR